MLFFAWNASTLPRETLQLVGGMGSNFNGDQRERVKSYRVGGWMRYLNGDIRAKMEKLEMKSTSSEDVGQLDSQRDLAPTATGDKVR